ncbi:MAG: patatin-like phospholipase family protein [Pontibacterium sp.]
MTTVSLVLGSGGARGYAHIGIIEELEQRGYDIICVAGSSMGALIGGMYAAGGLETYRDWVLGLSGFDMVRLLDMALTRESIQDERLFQHLRGMIGDPQIEDLPLPYTAVATDIGRQKEAWFQRGSLLSAMRASIAVPGIFTPYIHGNRVYVDGGLLNPLPIIPTVAAHADLIIAVDLNSREPGLARLAEPDDEYLSSKTLLDRWLYTVKNGFNGNGQKKETTHTKGRFDLLWNSIEVTQASLTQYKIAGYPPDLMIPIAHDLCHFFEFDLAKEVIEQGRQAARQRLDLFEGKSAESS